MDDRTPLFEPDIEYQVRLPWPTICKLAVKARCLGVSLNELAERAIGEAVAATMDDKDE